MTFKHSRAEHLSRLEADTWDIVVVGGGITGAGILREATRRGLKAVLLEQKDFAWGTSSRSSKMVHGGMRYLKQGNIGLTRESVKERENLMKELPGLVDNRVYILPFYKGNRLQRFTVHLGLILYDLLSGRWRKHVYSRREMEKQAPLAGKKDLEGGFIINDAVTDDARLVLRVLSEAEKDGGISVNYCAVEDVIMENNRVCGVKAKDQVNNREYQIKARLVINATGAWADVLRGKITKKNNHHIRPLRGSHLIFSAERIPLIDNISYLHPKDRRPVMIMAWEGRVLTGTTDIDHRNGLSDEAIISQEEIVYLLEGLNSVFPDVKATKNDIISTMAGIRPVIDTGKKDPSKEARDHVVWVEEGLLTVTGGKLTTFRVIALDALKKAQAVLGSISDLNVNQPVFKNRYKIPDSNQHGLSIETLRRLYGRYGSPVETQIDQAEKEQLAQIPGTETLWVELVWAAAFEKIVHLDDLLLRRTRIGLLLKEGGKEYLPKIRQFCQSTLGWDDHTWEREADRYLKIWKKHYSLPLPN